MARMNLMSADSGKVATDVAHGGVEVAGTSAKLAYAPEGMPIPETPENSRKPGSPLETPEKLGSPPETPEKQAFLMTLWKSQLFS